MIYFSEKYCIGKSYNDFPIQKWSPEQFTLEANKLFYKRLEELNF